MSSSKPASIDWKQARLLLAALIVLAVVGVGALIFAQTTGYRFSETVVGTRLLSNNAPIGTEIASFGGAESYLVGVELRQGEGVGNGYQFNAANLFSVVLIGNHKPVKLLYFSTDPAGQALNCRTNDGNVLTDRELSITECDAFWNGFSGYKAKIAWPQKTASESQVLFGSRMLTVAPKDFESVGRSSFTVLSRAFPNAQALLDAVNSIAGKIG